MLPPTRWRPSPTPRPLRNVGGHRRETCLAAPQPERGALGATTRMARSAPHSMLHRTTGRRKQPRGTTLEKEDDERQNEYLTHHGAVSYQLQERIQPANAKRRSDGAGEFANASGHHHDECIHDIVLAQVGLDVANQC